MCYTKVGAIFGRKGGGNHLLLERTIVLEECYGHICNAWKNVWEIHKGNQP
jgi:hypothetical protein